MKNISRKKLVTKSIGRNQKTQYIQDFNEKNYQRCLNYAKQECSETIT